MFWKWMFWFSCGLYLGRSSLSTSNLSSVFISHVVTWNNQEEHRSLFYCTTFDYVGRRNVLCAPMYTHTHFKFRLCALNVCQKQQIKKDYTIYRCKPKIWFQVCSGSLLIEATIFCIDISNHGSPNKAPRRWTGHLAYWTLSWLADAKCRWDSKWIPPLPKKMAAQPPIGWLANQRQWSRTTTLLCIMHNVGGHKSGVEP